MKKKKKQSFNLFVFIAFVSILAAAFIITSSINETDQNIKGARTEKQKTNLSDLTTTPREKCRIRVSSFSVNSACEDENKFQSATFSCSDGFSGSVSDKSDSTKCRPIEYLWQRAREACQKRCKPTKEIKEKKQRPIEKQQ